MCFYNEDVHSIMVSTPASMVKLAFYRRFYLLKRSQVCRSLSVQMQCLEAL